MDDIRKIQIEFQTNIDKMIKEAKTLEEAQKRIVSGYGDVEKILKRLQEKQAVTDPLSGQYERITKLIQTYTELKSVVEATGARLRETFSVSNPEALTAAKQLQEEYLKIYNRYQQLQMSMNRDMFAGKGVAGARDSIRSLTEALNALYSTAEASQTALSPVGYNTLALSIQNLYKQIDRTEVSLMKFGTSMPGQESQSQFNLLKDSLSNLDQAYKLGEISGRQYNEQVRGLDGAFRTGSEGARVFNAALIASQKALNKQAVEKYKNSLNGILIASRGTDIQKTIADLRTLAGTFELSSTQALALSKTIKTFENEAISQQYKTVADQVRILGTCYKDGAITGKEYVANLEAMRAELPSVSKEYSYLTDKIASANSAMNSAAAKALVGLKDSVDRLVFDFEKAPESINATVQALNILREDAIGNERALLIIDKALLSVKETSEGMSLSYLNQQLESLQKQSADGAITIEQYASALRVLKQSAVGETELALVAAGIRDMNKAAAQNRMADLEKQARSAMIALHEGQATRAETVASLERITAAMDQDSAAAQKWAMTLAKTRTAMGDMSVGLSGLDRFFTTMKHHALWMASGALLFPLYSLPQEVWKVSTELDAAFSKLKTAFQFGTMPVDEIKKKMEELQNAAFTLGKYYGEDVSKIADVMFDVAKRYKSNADIIVVTNQILKMSLLDYQNDVGASSKALISFMAHYEMAPKYLDQFVNKVIVAAHIVSTTAGEIMESLQKSSALFHEMGFTEDQAIALTASALSKSGQTAQLVGTAYVTITRRMREFSAQLHKFGVDIFDDNDHLKTTAEILDAITKKYESLNDKAKGIFTQQLGGSRALAVLIPSLRTPEVFDNLMNAMSDPKKMAVETEAALTTMRQTYIRELKTVGAAWEQFVFKINNSMDLKNTVMMGIGWLMELMKFLGKNWDSIKEGTILAVEFYAAMKLWGLILPILSSLWTSMLVGVDGFLGSMVTATLSVDTMEKELTTLGLIGNATFESMALGVTAVTEALATMAIRFAPILVMMAATNAFMRSMESPEKKAVENAEVVNNLLGSFQEWNKLYAGKTSNRVDFMNDIGWNQRLKLRNTKEDYYNYLVKLGMNKGDYEKDWNTAIALYQAHAAAGVPEKSMAAGEAMLSQAQTAYNDKILKGSTLNNAEYKKMMDEQTKKLLDDYKKLQGGTEGLTDDQKAAMNAAKQYASDLNQLEQQVKRLIKTHDDYAAALDRQKKSITDILNLYPGEGLTLERIARFQAGWNEHISLTNKGFAETVDTIGALGGKMQNLIGLQGDLNKKANDYSQAVASGGVWSADAIQKKAALASAASKASVSKTQPEFQTAFEALSVWVKDNYGIDLISHSSVRKNLNKGSLHEAGLAADANIFTKGDLSTPKAYARMLGLDMIDERSGPAAPGLAWTGPHIHIGMHRGSKASGTTAGEPGAYDAATEKEQSAQEKSLNIAEQITDEKKKLADEAAAYIQKLIADENEYSKTITAVYDARRKTEEDEANYLLQTGQITLKRWYEYWLDAENRATAGMITMGIDVKAVQAEIQKDPMKFFQGIQNELAYLHDMQDEYHKKALDPKSTKAQKDAAQNSVKWLQTQIKGYEAEQTYGHIHQATQQTDMENQKKILDQQKARNDEFKKQQDLANEAATLSVDMYGVAGGAADLYAAKIKLITDNLKNLRSQTATSDLDLLSRFDLPGTTKEQKIAILDSLRQAAVDYQKNLQTGQTNINSALQAEIERRQAIKELIYQTTELYGTSNEKQWVEYSRAEDALNNQIEMYNALSEAEKNNPTGIKMAADIDKLRVALLSTNPVFKEIKALAEAAGQAIKTSIHDNIQAVINKEKNLGQAIRDIFKDQVTAVKQTIIDALSGAIIQKAGKGIGGFENMNQKLAESIYGMFGLTAPDNRPVLDKVYVESGKYIRVHDEVNKGGIDNIGKMFSGGMSDFANGILAMLGVGGHKSGGGVGIGLDLVGGGLSGGSGGSSGISFKSSPALLQVVSAAIAQQIIGGNTQGGPGTQLGAALGYGMGAAATGGLFASLGAAAGPVGMIIGALAGSTLDNAFGVGRGEQRREQMAATQQARTDATNSILSDLQSIGGKYAKMSLEDLNIPQLIEQSERSFMGLSGTSRWYSNQDQVNAAISAWQTAIQEMKDAMAQVTATMNNMNHALATGANRLNSQGNALGTGFDRSLFPNPPASTTSTTYHDVLGKNIPVSVTHETTDAEKEEYWKGIEDRYNQIAAEYYQEKYGITTTGINSGGGRSTNRPVGNSGYDYSGFGISSSSPFSLSMYGVSDQFNALSDEIDTVNISLRVLASQGLDTTDQFKQLQEQAHSLQQQQYWGSLLDPESAATWKNDIATKLGGSQTDIKAILAADIRKEFGVSGDLTNAVILQLTDAVQQTANSSYGKSPDEQARIQNDEKLLTDFANLIDQADQNLATAAVNSRSIGDAVTGNAQMVNNYITYQANATNWFGTKTEMINVVKEFAIMMKQQGMLEPTVFKI